MSGDEGGSEASGRSGDSLTLHAAATVPLAAARKDAPPPKAKSSGGKATGVSALVPLLLRGAAHVLAGRAVVTALSLAAVCSKLLIADVLPTHLARSDYHWPAQAGGIRGVDKKAKVHNTTAEGGTASPKAVLLDARFMDPENTEDWAHLLAGLQDQELLRLLKPEVATL